jgi:hypothetical protein
MAYTIVLACTTTPKNGGKSLKYDLGGGDCVNLKKTSTFKPGNNDQVLKKNLKKSGRS